MHHHADAADWYDALRFPLANGNNLDPYPELARLAAGFRSAVRGRSMVQGLMREGYVIEPFFRTDVSTSTDARGAHGSTTTRGGWR